MLPMTSRRVAIYSLWITDRLLVTVSMGAAVRGKFTHRAHEDIRDTEKACFKMR